MQSDLRNDVLDRNGRKVLGNSLLGNWSTNGSDIDSKGNNMLGKNHHDFKMPQTTSHVTSTPKNLERTKFFTAEAMQTTYSSVDMGYSTMGCSNDLLKTPITRNCSSRNITALSVATSSETSAPAFSQHSIFTPWNKLRADLHCESGYASDEGRPQKFFPPYFHSTPYIATNRLLLDSAESDRNVSMFRRTAQNNSIVRLNLSEISAYNEESMHEISHCQHLTPEATEARNSRAERSLRRRNYFSFDESLGNIGSNMCHNSFNSLLLNVCRRQDKTVASKLFGYLHDSDVSRLFLVSKELREVMSTHEDAVLRREKFFERVKSRLANKENSETARHHSMIQPRPGPRKPLKVVQPITSSAEKRRREPTANETFDEATIRRDGMCVHCSSCWKTASVIGIVATCTNSTCGFQRCMMCGRQAHANRPCPKRQSLASTSYSVGSRESKNNLKRIARRC